MMMEPTPDVVSALCLELLAAQCGHANRRTFVTSLKVQHLKRAVNSKAHAVRDTFRGIEGNR